MSVSRNVTLCVRPSLAVSGRWSVDYWLNAHPEAGYQASLVTFASPEEAVKAQNQIKATLEAKGDTVQLLREDKNVSRDTIASPQESEEEIKNRLKEHVEKAFEPLGKLSVARFFDINNWAKSVKAITMRSPHLLGLLTLAALFFHGPWQKLLMSIAPKELSIEASHVLAGAPLLILAATLFVHFNRVRESYQLDRVRQWVLQLVVFFGWDRDRFLALVRKEPDPLEYASAVSLLERAVKWDPGSLSNLAHNLGVKLEGSGHEKVEQLIRYLLRDDFARKIQALAGLAGEDDYRPKHLAIVPVHLLVSLDSVKATAYGLLADTSAAVDSSRQFREGMTLLGMTLGVLLGLVAIVPALVWTTALSLKVSSMLFILDLVASLLTVSLLTGRSLAVALRRSFVPRGLMLHEYFAALNVH